MVERCDVRAFFMPFGQGKAAFFRPQQLSSYKLPYTLFYNLTPLGESKFQTWVYGDESWENRKSSVASPDSYRGQRNGVYGPIPQRYTCPAASSSFRRPVRDSWGYFTTLLGSKQSGDARHTSISGLVPYGESLKEYIDFSTEYIDKKGAIQSSRTTL